ncbi:hypothetical protein C8R46DRAFT_1035294 [Mycena filopes]|nr:hypothetical protein C8R46DRAFT_1035294 [Mycena filopes]
MIKYAKAWRPIRWPSAMWSEVRFNSTRSSGAHNDKDSKNSAGTGSWVKKYYNSLERSTLITLFRAPPYPSPRTGFSITYAQSSCLHGTFCERWVAQEGLNGASNDWVMEGVQCARGESWNKKLIRQRE